MLNDHHFYPEKAQAMRQRVAIFESSESAVHAEFISLLREEQFNEIDFARFSVATDNPLAFNLSNLMSAKH